MSSVNELSQIASIANSIGVPGLLLYAVWYFKKEIKEYQQAHKEEIKALREEHKLSLAAQRDAHLAEKNDFFANLREGFASIAKELKDGNTERLKIMSKIENNTFFQNDISLKMANVENALIEMKTKLEAQSSLINLLKKESNNNKDKDRDYSR